MKKKYSKQSIDVEVICVEDVICVSIVVGNLDIITTEPDETL